MGEVTEELDTRVGLLLWPLLLEAVEDALLFSIMRWWPESLWWLEAVVVVVTIFVVEDLLAGVPGGVGGMSWTE